MVQATATNMAKEVKRKRNGELQAEHTASVLVERERVVCKFTKRIDSI